MQTNNTQIPLTKTTHSFDVDAFNRKVREQHTGFDGRKINSDTHYDNLGKVTRASLPYFTTHHDLVDRQKAARILKAGQRNRDNDWGDDNLAALTKTLTTNE